MVIRITGPHLHATSKPEDEGPAAGTHPIRLCRTQAQRARASFVSLQSGRTPDTPSLVPQDFTADRTASHSASQWSPATTLPVWQRDGLVLRPADGNTQDSTRWHSRWVMLPPGAARGRYTPHGIEWSRAVIWGRMPSSVR